jgi:hypothetical protein
VTTIAVGPRAARAAEIRTVTRTLGEGYVVRVPGPEGQLLSRRRLVQYVNLGVYDLLQPRDRGELRRAHEDGQLRLVTSMRVRHDFGSYTTRADGRAATLVNQLDTRQIDVMFAYLEADNLRGMIDLRVGRQFEMSGLDWYAFDGAWFRLRTPIHLGIEAFGGFQVDGTALFGFPTFEQDGTAGTPADSKRSPMVGAAASVIGLRWLDARVAYRRTFSPLGVNRSIVNDDGSTRAGERGRPGDREPERGRQRGGRAALAVRGAALQPRDGAARRHLGGAAAGVHDEAHAARDVPAHAAGVRPRLDLQRVQPAGLRGRAGGVSGAAGAIAGRWRRAGQFRFFRDAVTAHLNTVPERKLTVGAGGGATASYRIRRFSARLDGYGIGGEGGLRVGGNLDTRTMIAWDRVAIDGRVFALRYRDEVTAARQGYSIAAAGGRQCAAVARGPPRGARRGDVHELLSPGLPGVRGADGRLDLEGGEMSMRELHDTTGAKRQVRRDRLIAGVTSAAIGASLCAALAGGLMLGWQGGGGRGPDAGRAAGDGGGDARADARGEPGVSGAGAAAALQPRAAPGAEDRVHDLSHEGARVDAGGRLQLPDRARRATAATGRSTRVRRASRRAATCATRG